MTVVAISAAYGAGGSVIGPAVAERLEVEFVDRLIPVAVAQRLDVPLDDVEAHDERTPAPNWLERLLRGFTNTDSSVPAPVAPDSFTSEDFRRATEEVILRLARTGRGVILGRGAVIVLREWRSVLRVRLDGPPEGRVAQAMALGDHDRPTAEAAMRRLDRTQAEYAQQLYGVNIGDPTLYHLVIDSTAIGADECVSLITLAAQSLALRV